MDRTFLVECYWPGVTEGAHAEAVSRASQTSGRVQFLDSLLMLEDETVFYRFAAVSADEVEHSCACSDLTLARIVEYVDTTRPGE